MGSSDMRQALCVSILEKILRFGDDTSQKNEVFH